MLAEGELDAVLHPDIIEPIVKKDPACGAPERKKRRMEIII